MDKMVTKASDALNSAYVATSNNVLGLADKEGPNGELPLAVQAGNFMEKKVDNMMTSVNKALGGVGNNARDLGYSLTGGVVEAGGKIAGHLAKTVHEEMDQRIRTKDQA